VLLVKVATPFVSVAGVLFSAVLSLKNVTVPVGVIVPDDGLTVAEKVTLVPAVTGDAGKMLNVVEVATDEIQFVRKFAMFTEPRHVD
jgi:hypothetical protein